MLPKKPPLGSGKRFEQLEEKLEKKPGIKNPAALSAFIGSKKYGKEKMSKLAKAGKKRGK